jgi:hypothetical protein
MDKHTVKQRVEQMDEWTDREIDRNTDRKRDRQNSTWSGGQTERLSIFVNHVFLSFQAIQESPDQQLTLHEIYNWSKFIKLFFLSLTTEQRKLVSGNPY